MRTIESQRLLALDVLKWVKTLEFDENAACYTEVLNTFVADTERIRNGQEVAEHHYDRLWRSQAIAAILIEELQDEYPELLTGYVPGTIPNNMCQVLMTALDDSLFRFTQVLLSVRRKRGRDFHPMSIAAGIR